MADGRKRLTLREPLRDGVLNVLEVTCVELKVSIEFGVVRGVPRASAKHPVIELIGWWYSRDISKAGEVSSRWRGPWRSRDAQRLAISILTIPIPIQTLFGLVDPGKLV